MPSYLSSVIVFSRVSIPRFVTEWMSTNKEIITIGIDDRLRSALISGIRRLIKIAATLRPYDKEPVEANSVRSWGWCAFFYICSTGKVLHGIQYVNDNGPVDQRFRFQCCELMVEIGGGPLMKPKVWSEWQYDYREGFETPAIIGGAMGDNCKASILFENWGEKF